MVQSLLSSMTDFQDDTISFHDLASILRQYPDDLAQHLKYEHDFANHVDCWLEVIEYCYPENDWKRLGSHVTSFIEELIRNPHNQVIFPADDPVLSRNLPQIIEK